MSNINITVNDPNEFPPLPDNIYKCLISWWGLPKANKKGTGFFTSVTFDVTEGEYTGRKIFEYLNLKHENKTAEKIAEQKKNAILVAAGFEINDVITSTKEIEGKCLLIEVINEEDGNQKLKFLKPETSLNQSDVGNMPQNQSTDSLDKDISF